MDYRFRFSSNPKFKIKIFSILPQVFREKIIKRNMKREKDIQEEVDKTLEITGRIEKAGPQPFFYTRLKSRLEMERISKPVGKFGLMLPPKWALVLSLILFALNLLIFGSLISSSSQYSRQQNMQTFAKEYHLTTTQGIEYLTFE